MPSYCHSFCLPPVWRGSGENPHHPNENEFGRAAVCVCGSRAKIDSVRGETFLWRRARWRRAEPKRRENVRLPLYEQSGRSESLSFLDEVDLTSKRERERDDPGRKEGIPITGWKLDTDNTIRKMLTFD